MVQEHYTLLRNPERYVYKQRRTSMPPVSFHIQQTENGRYQVLKNGVAVGKEYRSEREAQTYIDTYRQAAARLHLPETPEELPLDALTDEERTILSAD